jgi:hypothetical protein
MKMIKREIRRFQQNPTNDDFNDEARIEKLISDLYRYLLYIVTSIDSRRGGRERIPFLWVELFRLVAHPSHPHCPHYWSVGPCVWRVQCFLTLQRKPIRDQHPFSVWFLANKNKQTNIRVKKGLQKGLSHAYTFPLGEDVRLCSRFSKKKRDGWRLAAGTHSLDECSMVVSNSLDALIIHSYKSVKKLAIGMVGIKA